MPFSMSSRKAREHALAEFDENRRAARMLNPVGDENEGETPVAGAWLDLSRIPLAVTAPATVQWLSWKLRVIGFF